MKLPEKIKIYYHKPAIRKINTATNEAKNAEYNLLRIKQEYSDESLPENAQRLSENKAFSPKPAEKTPFDVVKEKIFNCSAKTLQTFGLTGKYDGFKYICTAVEKILTCEKKPHFQSIYSQIAKEQNVSNFCVERDIRYAIKRIIDPEKRMKMTAVFGDFARNGKFSNSRFLTMLAADIFEKLFLLENVRLIPTT
ncbi:MAG: hypothetical protein J6036_06695 [Clostridia bacterium]|nr:hypothetical protein [Clostridia bacterium]